LRESCCPASHRTVSTPESAPPPPPRPSPSDCQDRPAPREAGDQTVHSWVLGSDLAEREIACPFATEHPPTVDHVHENVAACNVECRQDASSVECSRHLLRAALRAAKSCQRVRGSVQATLPSSLASRCTFRYSRAQLRSKLVDSWRNTHAVVSMCAPGMGEATQRTFTVSRTGRVAYLLGESRESSTTAGAF
jgi:hypothetical protein